MACGLILTCGPNGCDCEQYKEVLMEPQTKLEDKLHEVRDVLTPTIQYVKAMVDDRPKACGAEITLALRKLQECRMWLGVAEALEIGLDPWANQIEEKE